MKKIYLISILIFLLNTNLVFSDEQKKGPDSYFKKYEEHIKSFCIDKKNSPWYKENEILIKVKDPVYTFFEDSEIDSKYNNYLQKLGVNGIGNTINSLINSPFEKAKTVYTETQNVIFNCAILKAKLNIGNIIMEYVKNDKNSNIFKKINDQNTILSKQISQTCSAFNSQTQSSYKTILLNNATYQYCIYKYYLNYLNLYLKNNISAALEQNQSESDKYAFSSILQSTNLSKSLIKQQNLLQIEDEKARNIYKQAIITFEEFENTYGSHLLLSSIHSEYITVRNNFKKLLNPISQIGFKIPQAQKQ